MSKHRLYPIAGRRWLVMLGVGVAAHTAPAARHFERSVMRVTVTSQAYDFLRPWQKRPPTTKQGLGVAVGPNRILTTATLVANATVVELEQIGSGDKMAATVMQVDYGANLALLKADDAAFGDRFRPVGVLSRARPGDGFTACQFEANDSPRLTAGEMKSAEVAPYPIGASAYLVYNISVAFDGDASSYTAPFFRRGRLAGLMMRYDRTERLVTLVPPPVIRHFLDDLDDGVYDGFPRAGFGFAPVEDPQLRRYVGMSATDSGVYLSKVMPGSAAAAAGLREGDVLLAIDAFEIDKFGEYEDPEYGRLSMAHLTTTRHRAGDTLAFRLLRDGEHVIVPVTLTVIGPDHYPVRPFSLDRAPEFLVAAGLVFQPLSRSYLRAWGGNWEKSAPHRLRYYDHNQWDLLSPGEQLVVLSYCLPTTANTGYEHLRALPVEAINGRHIHGLGDVRAALGQPENGFHHIRFVGRQTTDIYLAATALPTGNAEVLQRYGLPSLSHLER